MNLARIAVINQQAFFVIFPCRTDRFAAVAAFPLLGVEVDTQIFGDQNLHMASSILDSRQARVAVGVNAINPARSDTTCEERLLNHAGTAGGGARRLI